MAPLTIVFPPDRPGDATYASLAAQVEAGLVRVIQDRRSYRERRSFNLRRTVVSAREHGRRQGVVRRVKTRRQASPLPVGPRIVVTV